MAVSRPALAVALGLAAALALPACRPAGGEGPRSGGSAEAAAPAEAAATTRAEVAGGERRAAGEELPPPASVGLPQPEPPPGAARPAWLGTRVLPLRPDGFGQVQPTPAELRDRRLPTVDLLPPPADGAFRATLDEVPADVAARSTWSPDCPVALAELRYVTVTFHGFDGRAHTGELLVNAAVAQDVVGVFRRLHATGFPLEEVRVVGREELDAPPTGDGNTTTAFVCRPVTGGTAWSQHAYGLAVDVNPFHNPYLKGDLVVPELASAYADRTRAAPGMVVAGDAVTSAFAEIGWGWGGTWRSARDYMHFSSTGR
jgi:hypothetical protein